MLFTLGIILTGTTAAYADNSSNRLNHDVDYINLDYDRTTEIFSIDYSFDIEEQCAVKLYVNTRNSGGGWPLTAGKLYPDKYTFVGGQVIKEDINAEPYIKNSATPIEVVPCSTELTFPLSRVTKAGNTVSVSVVFYKVNNNADRYDDLDKITAVEFDHFTLEPETVFCGDWVDKNLVINSNNQETTCNKFNFSEPIVIEPPTFIIESIINGDDRLFVYSVNSKRVLVNTVDGVGVSQKMDLRTESNNTLIQLPPPRDAGTTHDIIDFVSVECLNNGNPFDLDEVNAVFFGRGSVFIVITAVNGDNIVCTFTNNEIKEDFESLNIIESSNSIPSESNLVISQKPTPELIPEPTPEPIPTQTTITWSAEGDANDSSGTNNGILGGNTTYADGVKGQAFSFDGNDYISLKNPNLPTGSIATVTAWVYPTYYSDVKWNGIISWGDRVRYDTFSLAVQNNGMPSFAGWHAQYIPTDGPTLDIDKWNFIAAVVDGTSVTLYVNDKSTTGTLSTALNFSSKNLSIGSNDYEEGRGFTGLVDEISVYNYALTSEEITSVRSEITPVPQSSQSQTLGPPPKVTIMLLTNDFFLSAPAFDFKLTSVEEPTINVPLKYREYENTKDFTLTDFKRK